MSDSHSESHFVDRVNRGTESAATEIDRRYRRRLCRLVERELACALRMREDPEDVVQTVFRTYFRRAAQGEFRILHSSDLWALLARITRRKILKRVEYHQAQKRKPDAEDVGEVAWLSRGDPGPVDLAVAAELVEMTLAGLPPATVEVFELRVAGCTEEEISQRLHCTRASVRLKLERIRQRLAKLAPDGS